MAKLEVKVLNTLGVFEGVVTLPADSTMEDAVSMMKNLIGGINEINSISIEDEKGSATVFSREILNISVVQVKAVE